MDIVTDLTAEAIAYVVLFQDILKSNPGTIPEPRSISNHNWPEKIKEYLERAELTPGQHNRIRDLVWHSPSCYEQGRLQQIFAELVAAVIGWLTDNLMIDADHKPAIYERLVAYFDQENNNAEIFQSPFHWRQQFRYTLYEAPIKRVSLARALNYLPIQVVLALNGKMTPVYEVRLYQYYVSNLSDAVWWRYRLFSKTDGLAHTAWWASTIKIKPSKKRHGTDHEESEGMPSILGDMGYMEAATKLLTEDDLLLKVLRFRKFTLPFETLFVDELKEIERAREKRRDEYVKVGDKKNNNGENTSIIDPIPPLSNPKTLKDPIEKAQEMQLYGLALSGGGIRSATFNLGIIQRLASLGLLQRFDYISTVSGGGYIGTWLTSWIKRTGSVNKIGDRLCPDKSGNPLADEVRPIRWLRMFSNYISPQATIMSADAWTSGMTWLRNMLINQAVLLLCLVSILSFIDLFFSYWKKLVLTGQPIQSPISVVIFLTLIFIPTIIMVSTAMHAFHRPNTNKPLGAFQRWKLHLKNKYQILRLRATLTPHLLVIWCVLCAVMVSIVLAKYAWTKYELTYPLYFAIAIPATIVFWIVAWGGNYHKRVDLDLAGLDNVLPSQRKPGTTRVKMHNSKIHFAIAISSIISAALFAIMFSGLGFLPNMALKVFTHRNGDRIFGLIEHDRIILVFGIPLIIEVFAVAVIFRMALMGNLFPDHRREWWGRIGGYTNRFILIWILVTFSALIMPDLCLSLDSISLPVAWGGWFGIVSWGAKKAFESQDITQKKFNFSIILLKIVPFVFMIGVLLIGAWLLKQLHFWVEDLMASENTTNIVDMCIPNADKYLLGKVLTVCFLILITFGLSWRVGVNEFSLHHFYRNRLIRAFLGATRTREHRNNTANLFTGFDTNDDILLRSLTTAEGYFGPFPVINAALNATVVSALDRQDRKAESFVFSPLYCGFDFSPTRASTYDKDQVYEYGYRPTEQYSNKDGGPTLGTAMAISGAAINPNWGYHSSSTIAFLLTLFNLRLGWWIGNPRLDKWQNADPKIGLLYLMRDLIGKSDISMDYVCLSDGGHFDNMGLYELIRRRCRYIILGDGEQDKNGRCEGLANAIRRCRIDFGVEIEFKNFKGFTKNNTDHLIKGSIKYPGTNIEGTLIYIKAGLTGDEPADILEYAMANKDFPQQSTSDQFFDEAQFESYRKLGYHSIRNQHDLQM